MAADITDIMAALETAVRGAFPAVETVLVRAAPATHPGKMPMPGWTPGTALPCFCISEMPEERIDAVGSFGLYSVGFPVAVEYVKSGSPQNWADDTDVRDKRQSLIDLLYVGKPNALAGMVSTVFDVRLTPLPVYAANEAGTAVASGIVLTYTLTRVRG